MVSRYKHRVAVSACIKFFYFLLSEAANNWWQSGNDLPKEITKYKTTGSWDRRKYVKFSSVSFKAHQFRKDLFDKMQEILGRSPKYRLFVCAELIDEMIKRNLLRPKGDRVLRAASIELALILLEPNTAISQQSKDSWHDIEPPDSAW